MSDLEVLAATRNHLLKEGVAPKVHLAIPPHVSYPFILIELKEMRENNPLQFHNIREKIIGCIKFKILILSQNPGIEEIASISQRTQKALEGKSLVYSAPDLPPKVATFQLLSCGVQPLNYQSIPLIRSIHHTYNTLIKG